ncbi:PLA2G2E [Branchiostoma lanceolatum]|uniref:PLA2G2E protein n=1 Tax=Branchiostoma lanceolatum TaxID=7740 RepID=A0A8J9Z8L6_BRALA|nr:PLA2G2E [Branchiostoma lanceolatum]
MWGKLLLVICVVAAFNTGANADPTSVLGDEPRHRQKRNLVQFGNMITAVTGRSSLDYNNYGCYCGLGGSGTPVDKIDECCQTHDACYGSVSWPKITTYDYTAAAGTVTCNDAPGTNDRAVCECDRAAVLCFNSHMYTVKKPCPEPPTTEPPTTEPPTTEPPTTTDESTTSGGPTNEDCYAPPNKPNANPNDCNAPYTHGEVCNYVCSDGYSRHSAGGDGKLTCNNGAWVGDELFCIGDCDEPPNLPNTVRNGCDAPYTHMEGCEYKCRDGYSKVSGDEFGLCHDGSWLFEDLVCEATQSPQPGLTGAPSTAAPSSEGPPISGDCDPPPYPPNTVRTGCTPPYRNGDECDYECSNGYSRHIGDNKLTCNDGEWNGDELSCVGDCDPPPDPDNTEHNGCTPPYQHHDGCNYECKDGFSKESGDDWLICIAGEWFGDKLVCTASSTAASSTAAPTSDRPTDGPPISDQCPVDLIFLIDGSSSIGREGFEKAKYYISYIIGCFSNGDINVGVIQYECTPKVDIPLGSHMDTVGLQDTILNDVVFSGGQARTGAAIRCMTSATPFREQARKVAVVATDGGKQAATVAYIQDPEEYVEYADEARAAGIELWAIATGREIFMNQTTLAIISGDPSRVVSLDLDNPCDVAARIEQCAP